MWRVNLAIWLHPCLSSERPAVADRPRAPRRGRAAPHDPCGTVRSHVGAVRARTPVSPETGKTYLDSRDPAGGGPRPSPAGVAPQANGPLRQRGSRFVGSDATLDNSGLCLGWGLRMPWARSARCLRRGCDRRHSGPYCADHIRQSPRNHDGVARQARGLGAEFELAKRLVIERDGGRCRMRLPGCTGVATTADHIVPRSHGGTADPSNLRASCGHCNSARGDGHTDTQVGQSSVTSVTRVTDEAGRGIENLRGPIAARTAWQPLSRAAKTRGKMSVAATAPWAGRPGSPA